MGHRCRFPPRAVASPGLPCGVGEAGGVDGAGGAGEVEDVIDSAAVEGLVDVELAELEAAVVLEMIEVREASSEQIVNDDDGIAFTEQGVTQVGAQESGTSGDQGAWITHDCLSFLVDAPAGWPSGRAGMRPTL